MFIISKNMCQSFRLVLLLLFFSCFSIVSVASEEWYSIAFDTLKVKLDTIYKDKPIREFSVGYYNNGVRDVKIDTIEVGCSCTTVYYKPVLLKPGEKSSINVKIDVSNLHNGEFIKDIYVYTAPTLQCNEIVLSGWIEEKKCNESSDK